MPAADRARQRSGATEPFPISAATGPPSRPRRSMLARVGLVPLVGCLLAGCTSGSAATSSTTLTAYVAVDSNVANPGDMVAVVDATTSTQKAPILTGTLPTGLGVTPDGAHVLVANRGGDTVVEIDAASGAIIKRAHVGLEPDAVAVAPNGAYALIANFGDNTVTPLILPSLRVGRPVPVGRQPVAIAISPNGSRAIVANFQDGTVTPIELPGLTPEVAVPAGREPSSVYITPDGGKVLVADFETSLVTPINLATLAPLSAVPVLGNPTGIAGLTSSTIAYVSSGTSVTPLDLKTDAAGAPIAIGTTAQGLAIDPKGTSVWVCGGNGTLVHVNVLGRRVDGQVQVGGQPSSVVIAGPLSPT